MAGAVGWHGVWRVLCVVAFCVAALPSVTAQAAPSGSVNEDAVAVIIGNTNYTGDRIPNVDYAHRDANAFKRFLIDVQGYREGNIIDLRDATQAQMTAAFGNDRTHEGTLWQYVRADESDVTVFYSGHGVPGLKSRRGYLLPVDADPNKPEINGYPVDTLYANLAKLGARSVTVYLDACFSGDSPKGMLIEATSGITVTPVLPKNSVNMVILTAASGTQFASWDKKAEHGLFTEHLLTALYGAADAPRYGKVDGTVTAGEVEKYLKRHMTYAAKRTYGRIQDATVKGSPETVLVAFGDTPPKRPRGPATQAASLTLPTFEVEEVDETYAALKVANVRSLPTTQSDKVGRLSAGTSVEVTGKAEVKGRVWWRVALSDGKTGFVWGPLLGPQVAAVTPPKVAVPSPVKPAVGVYPKRYKAGDTFKDCDDCPEMVVIPSGSFRMGDLSGDGDEDEKPVRKVQIGYSFAVGKYEVTQNEWVAVMGSNPSHFDGIWDPVEQVSWDDAKAFVEKLSRKTGKSYRLLSEAEWEYVARAGTRTKYSWGQEVGSRNANCNGCGSKWDGSRTAPVGSFGANAYGVYDMHGNVLEWVDDCWHDSYHGAPSNGSSWVSGGNCSRRVLRGGSWGSSPGGLRSAFRNGLVSVYRSDGLGFRVSRTVSR